MVREPVGQGKTVNVVTHDVDGIPVAADFVNADDIRVPELSRRAGFAEKLFRFINCELSSRGEPLKLC